MKRKHVEDSDVKKKKKKNREKRSKKDKKHKKLHKSKFVDDSAEESNSSDDER